MTWVGHYSGAQTGGRGRPAGGPHPGIVAAPAPANNQSHLTEEIESNNVEGINAWGNILNLNGGIAYMSLGYPLTSPHNLLLNGAAT